MPGARWQGDVLRWSDDGRRTYWLWDARFCRLLFNYSYNGLRYGRSHRFGQPKELPSKASYERKQFGILADEWHQPGEKDVDWDGQFVGHGIESLMVGVVVYWL